MSDPERLLDQKERALQTTLLRAALDESPPSGLTRRTLIALGVTPTGRSGRLQGEASNRHRVIGMATSAHTYR